ncbi:hypothetical protein AUJ46_06575 [Candidatus Peregrinibacteria bacterium CG1_02_54_53]|nr:MAG: hypothetical protein AUJ46_06575 [Candidatus Peregrinibacteria bacterium CG1_02_54_53]
MITPMKIPENPRENPADRPQETPAKQQPEQHEQQSQPTKPPEQEVVTQRADIIDHTRQSLEQLARSLPKPEGRPERFVA